MKNEKVVDRFVNDKLSGKGSNLYIEGKKLINYTTVIAYNFDGVIYLNGDKYSPSTTVNQNYIRNSGIRYWETTEEGLKEVIEFKATKEPIKEMLNGKPLYEEQVKEYAETSLYKLTLVMEKEIQYPLDEKISQPDTVYDIIEDVFDISNSPEELMVMLTLDTKNKITGLFVVSQGTINASIVHPREVYKRAILQNANSIILAHNHPSGDTTPSNEDVSITKRLVEVGELVGIKLLDHLIIGRGRYISFKEKGII